MSGEEGLGLVLVEAHSGVVHAGSETVKTILFGGVATPPCDGDLKPGDGSGFFHSLSVTDAQHDFAEILVRRDVVVGGRGVGDRIHGIDDRFQTAAREER